MKYLTTKFCHTLIIQSCYLIGLMIVVLPFASTAQQRQLSEEEEFISTKENLQTAVDSMDKRKLIQAQYTMGDFSNSNNKQLQKLAHYYIGYAAYRLSTQFPDIKEEQKDKFLDESVEHLKKAVTLDSGFAEAHALLGSAYGMKAAGFFSGMKYGPKSNNAIERALETTPENPRVHMVNAIGLLKKPSMFGGSTEGAIKEFKKAAELFESFQPANKLMPDWGHAENFAWLGQAYDQNEEFKKAKAAYRQALDADPNYGWVKYKLLPGLAEKME